MQFIATAALFFVAVSAVAVPATAPSSTVSPANPLATVAADTGFDFMPMAKAIEEANNIAIAEAASNEARSLDKRACFGLKAGTTAGDICIKACETACTLASAGLAGTLCAKACTVTL